MEVVYLALGVLIGIGFWHIVAVMPTQKLLNKSMSLGEEMYGRIVELRRMIEKADKQ